MARREFLRRLALALEPVDWQLLSYAIMSSHIHLALLAAADRLERLMRSLNTGFGLWLNKTQGRTGPVFENRYRSITIPVERTAYLLAYHHNNPVRANVVGCALASDWTSHRFYMGVEPAPHWLAVERGLGLCGFDSGPDGREAFGRLVQARAGDERDIELSGGNAAERRSRKRRDMGGEVELYTERATAPGELESPMFVRPDAPLRPRWDGPLPMLLRVVAVQTGVSVDRMKSRDRSRRVARARRIAVVAATRYLGRDQIEVAACVGISSSAASRLRSAAAHRVEIDEAAMLAVDELRRRS